MALSLKYQEGGETPKYSLYGEDYDFHDLERRVYEGFDDFASTIKYGKKNHDSIYSAVKDLMKGLESGRVTFENGTFIDHEGQYHNESKEKHDNYGIAAAWILLNMSLANRITPPTPETKEAYNSSAMGRYILEGIFGGAPTADDILYFIDLDDWLDDNKTSKNNSKRVGLLLGGINNALDNFDDIMSKYDISDLEKEKQKNYLMQAKEALEDNVLSDNEYLTLRRALGSGQWKELMRTDFSTTELQEDTVPEGKKIYKFNDWEIEAPEGTSIDDMVNWFINLLEDNPEDGDPVAIYTQSTTISDLAPVHKIKNTLNLYNANLLVKTLNDFLRNPNDPKNLINVMFNNIKEEAKTDKVTAEIKEPKNLIIEYIYKRLASLGAVTSLGDTQFIIDGVTSSEHPNMILVVDTSQHKFRWVSKYKHPKLRDNIRNQLRDQNSGISFRKRGGSLKFDGGGRVAKGQNDLIIPEGYINDFWDDFGNTNQYITWDTENRLQNVLQNDEIVHQKRVNGTTNKNANSEYDIENGGKKTEEQKWWKLWVDVLTSNKDIAEKWARQYRDLESSNTINPTNHYSTWFKDNDEFDFDAFKDYADPKRKLPLWEDALNGIGHDFFKGKIYYIDDNGTRRYYNAVPEGWEETENSDNPNSDLVNEIKLTRSAVPEEAPTPEEVPQPVEEKKPEGPISKTDPRNATLKRQGIDWGNLGKNLLPEGLAAGRLAGTIASNNRAYKILNRALHPYLQNTYERYSPVTGEFGLMLAYNLQAADYNRLAARNATSDAALNVVARLDANRLANQLREQGFLKDNDEIKRTATEALLRQEDNTKRRTEVGNENRKAINLNNLLKAELKAERVKQNWDAWNNFLMGIEQRIRTDQAERKQAYRTFAGDIAKLRAQNTYDSTMDPWKRQLQTWSAKNPGASPLSWDLYQNYLDAMKAASNLQSNIYFQEIANSLGLKYNPNTYSLRYKKGGKLIKRKK